MTTLVLHIGSPKTGSSAIQAAIRSPRFPWRSGSWCVLPTNPYRALEPAGCVATLYQESGDLPRIWAQKQQANPGRFNRDLFRYRRRLAGCLQPRFRNRPAAAFLSSEYLWTFNVDAIDRLRLDWLALGVDRFLIVAYVRSPLSFYRSALQQHARLSTTFRRFRPHRWTYRFRQRLQAWQEVFGEALIVRPYDRAQLHHGCVVQDLRHTVQRAAVDLPLLPAEPLPAAVNESVSVEEVIAMQELMQRCPPAGHDGSLRRSEAIWRQWARLSHLRAGHQATTVALRSDVQVMIQERHQSDLDWIAERFGVAFPCPDTLQGALAEHGPTEWPDNVGIQDLLDLQINEPWLEQLRGALSRCSLPRH